jgi:CubicO group peptidase (beta-lactamase class C family)
MDPAYLERADRFAREEAPQISAMLVARHGYVVFERYYGDYTAESSFSVNSVTKSVLSALVGIALRDGLVESVDQPIAAFFPDANAHGISIRHLLTLSTGWPYRERGERVWSVPHLLRQPLIRPPGEAFEYDEAAPHLLSAILTRLTGASAAAYARGGLFDSLGIWRDTSAWSEVPGTVHRIGAWPADGLPWKCDGEGISAGGFGLHLTAREMAKLGLLYASGGMWEDRQILPAKYVAESTQPWVRGGSPVWMPYGYLWWIPTWHRGQGMLAAGFGGQAIYVNSALDVVMAITCASRRGPEPHNGGILNRYLLPAVRDW